MGELNMIFASLRPFVLLLACVAAGPAALAQTFSGCGILVPGPPCPMVFQSDQGGTYALSTYGSFQLGDHVLVTGNFAFCPTACGVTNGCILQNTINTCSSGTPICFGDGTGTLCPCANSGAAGHGCANSLNPSGALLVPSGAASVSADTFVLSGSGMPNAAALYFQGSSALNGGLGAAFGDGLRCAGGQVLRLGTKTNASGASQYPETGDASVSVRGLDVAGDVRVYQVWYRNAATFCTSATYNLSNGVQVTWGI
jgi:hypothetical protein